MVLSYLCGRSNYMMYIIASLLSVYNRGFYDCSLSHSRRFMAYSVLNVNLPLWQDRNANDSLTDAKSWSFPAVHFRVISAAILDITQWNNNRNSRYDENVFRHSYKGLFSTKMRSYQQGNFHDKDKVVARYISYEALLNTLQNRYKQSTMENAWSFFDKPGVNSNY